MEPGTRAKAHIWASPSGIFATCPLAYVALGVTSGAFGGDEDTFERLFKSMCLRDLKAYAQCIRGNILCYKDSDGVTCDAVAETYERIFASAISEAENFSEILAVYTWLIRIIAVTGTVDVAVVTYLKRRGEFKTMRLCGMSKKDVAKVVAEELAIVVVIAGAVSALCGWGFTRLLDVALRSFGFALH